MKLVIDEKTFELKFGFGCFKILGKLHNMQSYDEVAKEIMEVISADKMTFDQEDFFKDLFYAAAEHAGSADAAYLRTDAFNALDFMLNNPKELAMVLKEISSGFPKAEEKEAGKPKARKPRKTPNRKS